MDEIKDDGKKDLKSNSDLPVVQKTPELMRKANFLDNLKRFGKSGAKIVGGMTLMTAGIAASAIAGTIGGPAVLIGGAVEAAAVTAGVLTTAFGGLEAIYKFDSDLMFGGRYDILSKEIKINQNVKNNLLDKMKELKPLEKMGMMQLQALVGFSRHKDNLMGKPYEERSDGTKVFNQKFSTVTHSVNLRTFEALENLGLIEIVEKNDKIRKSLITGKPKEKKSLLLLEKLGFDNRDDLKEIAKAIGNRDKKALSSKRRTMEKWTFRLTDKPVDFVDLYAKYQGLIPCESEKEKEGVRAFGMIFSSKRGILAKKNIDIGKDRYGRDVILYDVERNFGTRVDEEIDRPALLKKAIREGRKLDMPAIRAEAAAERQAKNPEGLSEFEKALRDGVDQTKVTAVIEEHREEVRKDLEDDGKINGTAKNYVKDEAKNLSGEEQSL